ncbi:Hypothetical_protein [Hexamita inflata]|uniref:Hypothetical_protein n=1 Tax=Hexamita inflata TaxID=28002 RepID=A0AA86PQI0_9EUKA|nr:Hypothetical protein HINF_LOCUS30643 [Hexamita inflata]
MVEVVFENFVNYLRSGNTDKLNIISFQQNQQHKINLSTQLIFYRILTKTVVQLKPIKNLCLQVYNPENSPSKLLKQFIYDFEPKLEELKQFSQTLKPQSRGSCIPKSSSQKYRIYKSQVE